MARPAWPFVVALVLIQAVLAHLATERAHERSVTYVFTPLVEVVPGGAPLSGGEASALAAEAKNQVDARDIQKAYAYLGSTIDLDVLLRGVESLDAAGQPLDAGQRRRVREILERARNDHAAVRAVQGEILDLEARLDTQVEEVLAALPADTRARVEARVTATRGPPKPSGAPPSPSAPSTGAAPASPATGAP